ncbi:ABC transporter ATP-binding protein [Streptomyces sp. bgisy153]|uniref:ABC transporter ATP-binding protein n=1 Tax=Streptomyces sp. bgisy153 TaxID=3413793 RepID=UPI003D72D9C9
MIRAEALTKEFRKYERRPGLRGSLGTLFSRKYETHRAVDSISFTVEAGAKMAYLGANGAGKSTTIKMLAGITTPTSGRCLVNGIEPYRNRRANAQSIGVVFGQRTQLWWDLSVPDSFRILQRIYDIPDEVYHRNLRLFQEYLDIDALASTQVRKLSLGQRMRAEIAASLLHDPKVVFWDEPTIGLDVILKDAVRELINHFNRELGTTVLLTSHDIGDITSICDQVLVVDRGRVIHQGTLQELISTAAYRSISFECGSEDVSAAIAAIEEALPKARATAVGGHRIRVDYPIDHLTSKEVLSRLLERFDITDFYAPEPELGSVVREIYGAGQTA